MLKWLLPSHLSLHVCIFYIFMYTKRNVRVGLPEVQNVRVTEVLIKIIQSGSGYNRDKTVNSESDL